VALAAVLQLLPVPALARILGLERLAWQDWLVVGGLAVIPALVGQSLKQLRMGRGRSLVESAAIETT
jgi:hypothetical protein